MDIIKGLERQLYISSDSPHRATLYIVAIPVARMPILNSIQVNLFGSLAGLVDVLDAPDALIAEAVEDASAARAPRLQVSNDLEVCESATYRC